MEKENENLKKILINLLNYIEVCRKSGILPSENFCKNVEESIEKAIGQPLPEYRYETIKVAMAKDKDFAKIACETMVKFLIDNKFYTKKKEIYKKTGKVYEYTFDLRIPRERKI